MKYLVLFFTIVIFAGLTYLIANSRQFKVYLPKGIPDVTLKITCNGKDERLEVAPQTGKTWCRKLLPDVGQPCTKSTDCMSGYCMVQVPQAASGKCFESKTGDYCTWGVTIEEARNKPKGSVIVPCVF